jgi:esterase/lipase superfamily enzyme
MASFDNSINEDGIELKSLIFLNPDYELDTFVNDYADLKQFAQTTTLYADSRDEAIKVSKSINRKANLGLPVETAARLEEEKKMKGFDLIDTADLDRNINTQFHGYFNINRVMVDDLRELIVTGKQAEERTTRLKKFGGLYRFTIIPSQLESI